MSRRLSVAGIAFAAAALVACGGGPEPRAETDLSPAARWAAEVAAVRHEAARGPETPYWPYRLAELYVEADSLEAAERQLDAALRITGDYAPALTLLSKLYYDSGRSDLAIPLLESAGYALSPEARLGLALHYERTGRPEDAFRISREVAGDGSAAPSVAYLYLHADEPEAAAAAERAVARDSTSAIGRNNLGVARLRAGDAPAARRELVRAMELDPFLPGPLYNLALLDHLFFQDDEAARRWFSRYWELSRDDPDSLKEALFPGRDVPSPFSRSE